MVDQLSRPVIGTTECPWRLVSSAAKVLDFIQIAWIFYPDDLDQFGFHPPNPYSASSGLLGL